MGITGIEINIHPYGAESSVYTEEYITAKEGTYRAREFADRLVEKHLPACKPVMLKRVFLEREM